jgi:acetate kinase
MKILVFNAGSSSQKSKLYDLQDTIPDKAPSALWEANADWTHKQDRAEIKIYTAHGQQFEQEIEVGSRSHIIEQLLAALWDGPTKVLDGPEQIDIVGHRIVHGGPDLRQSVVITPEVQATIKQLSEFAPLHNPANLEGIETAERILGKVPQVAVFDTAFHNTLPQEVACYPIPYEWFQQNVRRYGFHGISHQYCSQRAADILGRDRSSFRMINCHLGNGCSLAAIKDSKSIDTTMGFTPLEGLMMGGRSGTIDPSIPIYLQREKGYTVDQLEQMLNKEAGLKGISGVSSDMRQVIAAADQGNERAKLARDIYLYRLRFFIGALVASLNGVDAISFTGGVGENDAELRARTCEGLRYLNIEIDEQKNAKSPVDAEISTANSAVRILVIHTEEDWEIAKECKQLYNRHSDSIQQH